MDRTAISKDKEKDVRELLRFLDPTERVWFEENVFTQNENTVEFNSDSYSSDSDLDY